jgi:hypothetical protein
MKTLEQHIKKLLNLRNYRTNQFIIRIDSDNSCHIKLMKPHKCYDIATLQKIQEHFKSEIKEVVKLESYFTYPGYYKLYTESVLILKLK